MAICDETMFDKTSIVSFSALMTATDVSSHEVSIPKINIDLGYHFRYSFSSRRLALRSLGEVGRYRLSVRTHPFQGWKRGSTPRSAANEVRSDTALPVAVRGEENAGAMCRKLAAPRGGG